MKRKRDKRTRWNAWFSQNVRICLLAQVRENKYHGKKRPTTLLYTTELFLEGHSSSAGHGAFRESRPSTSRQKKRLTRENQCVLIGTNRSNHYAKERIRADAKCYTFSEESSKQVTQGPFIDQCQSGIYVQGISTHDLRCHQKEYAILKYLSSLVLCCLVAVIVATECRYGIDCVESP